MRGTTVKRLRKMARNASLGQPAVTYKPGIPVRMGPNCTRRVLKNLKQEWKQNHTKHKTLIGLGANG